jgi:hypothetical protein
VRELGKDLMLRNESRDKKLERKGERSKKPERI